MYFQVESLSVINCLHNSNNNQIRANLLVITRKTKNKNKNDIIDILVYIGSSRDDKFWRDKVYMRHVQFVKTKGIFKKKKAYID